MPLKLLRGQQASAPMPPASSYFWDAPQLPPDIDFPTYTDADGDECYLPFVCQVNLADAAIEGLPQQGMLYVFATVDYYMGFDAPMENGMGWWTPGTVKVLYSDAPADTLVRKNPYNDDVTTPPHPITPVRTDEPSGDGHRLLGLPFEDEARQEMPADCRLLMQIDSDEDDAFSLLFSDMGLLYIFINKESLRRADFSSVSAYMTSM